MDIGVAESINRFASEQADVPTAEHKTLFVQDGLESQKDLLQVVRDQNEIITALNAKLEVLEKDLDALAGNQLVQLRLIADLRENRKDPEPTKKTTNHLDEIYLQMREDKISQISLNKAARLLGISKERMRQMKPLILADSRFELGWGMIRGQKGVVIRIRKYLE